MWHVIEETRKLCNYQGKIWKITMLFENFLVFAGYFCLRTLVTNTGTLDSIKDFFEIQSMLFTIPYFPFTP